jgi:hypothetical protein
MDRVTFTIGNSSRFSASDMKAARYLGTPEYPAPLLEAVYKRKASDLGVSSSSIHTDPGRLTELKNAVARSLRDGDAFSGFESYVEVQFMGDLGMDDVLAIVVPAEDMMESMEK